MYVYVYACMHMCMHVYICICVCICVYAMRTVGNRFTTCANAAIVAGSCDGERVDAAGVDATSVMLGEGVSCVCVCVQRGTAACARERESAADTVAVLSVWRRGSMNV